MSTLLHLSQTVIDMQQELAREQRFANDSCHSLMKGIALLREATDALERDIRAAFEERDRAIARVLGGNVTASAPVDAPYAVVGAVGPSAVDDVPGAVGAVGAFYKVA